VVVFVGGLWGVVGLWGFGVRDPSGQTGLKAAQKEGN